MKKMLKFAFLAMFFLIPKLIFANEGMWFLMHIERLNGRDMQKMGLQLSPEEIYSINNHSLKDAVVQFNNGCTASIISDSGLVLTNHHCGYDAIAELSTPENNHLKNGFWAENYSKELKPKSLSVRFFVRMDNVTDRILSKLNPQMSEKDRLAAINQEIALIEKENNEGGKYKVSVRSFFQGNEFYYFVYQDFNDVRLVGTPEERIGKFGGDTDNWEWPRQTGDFAIFRVFADKNNNPAEYSKENVPYKPKKYLKINIGGVKEGDFAMILGYPGVTNRWQSSFWINQQVNYGYPSFVEASKGVMDALKPHMDKDQDVNLKYASLYASVANYWKNRQGMIDALTKHKTQKVKEKIEKKFQKWALKPENKQEYGEVLKTLQDYFAQTNQMVSDRNYFMTIFRASILGYSNKTYNGVLSYFEELKKDPSNDKILKILKQDLAYYDKISVEVEKSVLANSLKFYLEKSSQKSDFFNQIQKKYQGNTQKYVDEIFSESMFASKEKLSKFLENPSLEINNDALVKFSLEFLKERNRFNDNDKKQDAYQKAFRSYVRGMKHSGATNILYPDANSTLRLTYGKVRALPKDKRNPVKINNFTNYKSMLDKYKAGDAEFDLSPKMFKMYENNDFGRYLDKDGTLHLNFLTDNDITGGNSGSSVLNSKGEIIGLAFDGNIEAMAGDVIFDKKLQRTINVDIRYVLWCIENFYGAKHIVDEMNIVKN